MECTRDTIDILGVNVDATDLSAASKTIEDWIKLRQKGYVCVVPVSTVMACQDSQEYRETINSAAMATPDGMPLVWLGRLKGRARISRTYGPDLMRRLCSLGVDRGYRHFLYGGTAQTLEILEKKLKEQYPGLIVAGKYAPPFTREHPVMESEDVIDSINRAQADILWVGLGSPKQDFWMSLHRQRVETPVMIGVGAAFDFLAQTKPQAPRWMQSCGLEWLFRLCSEPRRLWKRYLLNNPRFVALFLFQLLTQRRSAR